MITRTMVVAFAATASLAVAACGGGGANNPQSSADSTRGIDAKTKKAMLQFAQCMRDHGVNMPDPQFKSGGATMQSSGSANPDAARAAEKACQKYQAQIKPKAVSAADQAKFRKAALANAQCMRSHGVPNFPDPQFDAHGGATMQFDKGNGINPRSPAFQSAQKACAKAGGPGGPMTTSVGG